MTDSFTAGGRVVPVLYLDNHLLAVEKPPNMPSQADASGDEDLLGACKRYIAATFQKPGEAYLGLVHRLDRPAGGAMVFARTSKAAARLTAAFCGRDVEKIYLAVVRGAPKAPGALEDYLVKGADGMVRAVACGAPGAKRAALSFRPLARAQGLALVEIRLETGRPHQIRVQLARAGHPLWGDNRYGDGVPGQQLALWSHRLTVAHPTRPERLTFRSDPPRSGVWALFEGAYA
jgi:23S rRNA pseudouridine1911/1915/1917 synthase